MVAVIIVLMFFLSLCMSSVRPFSFRVFPAATAIGARSITVPKSVFPPCCQASILSTASLITLPMPACEGLILSSASFTPRIAAFLKLGAAATADARNCS